MLREGIQCPYALYKHTALSYDVNAIDSRGVNSFEALCSLNFWQIQTCNLFKLRVDWCVFILSMIIQCGRWYKQLEYSKMMKSTSKRRVLRMQPTHAFLVEGLPEYHHLYGYQHHFLLQIIIFKCNLPQTTYMYIAGLALEIGSKWPGSLKGFDSVPSSLTLAIFS